MQENVKSLLRKFEAKRGKIDLSLDRIRKFLTKLGSPHLKLPPVIHIAGTNGKGSTLSFLRAMIEAEGKKCHVYTSPHLIRFNERIILRGNEISDDYLYDILKETDRQAEGEEVTFFELTTAAAFLAFSQIPADYLLLETGLGGRLDATNVVSNPALTIITPISLDHMEFLGNTLAEIAAEKAAIMKKSTICISAAQPPEVKKVLESFSAKIGSEVIYAPLRDKMPPLSLAGAHQEINASVAALAAEKIGLSHDAIYKGLQTAKWRGRLQRITKGPLAGLSHSNFELWLDGAHNEAGAAMLADFFRNRQPLYLIIGMMQRKDPARFLKYFSGIVKRIYCIPVQTSEAAFNNAELAKIASGMGFETVTADSAEHAVIDISLKEHKHAGILITGSLYLAGNILEHNS